MATMGDYPTNGAVAVLGEREFHELLQLPEGISIQGIYLSEMRRSIVLHLVGEALPPLREGYEADIVPMQCEAVRDDDGKVRTYLRLILPCPTCGGQGWVGDGGYVACPACERGA